MLVFCAGGADGDAVAFAVETGAAFVEVFLVEFAAHVVEAEFVGGDARGLTAHHVVEDAVTVFGELLKAVGVKFNRLLCRMDFALAICTAIDLPIQLGWLVE